MASDKLTNPILNNPQHVLSIPRVNNGSQLCHISKTYIHYYLGVAWIILLMLKPCRSKRGKRANLYSIKSVFVAHVGASKDHRGRVSISNNLALHPIFPWKRGQKFSDMKRQETIKKLPFQQGTF